MVHEALSLSLEEAYPPPSSPLPPLESKERAQILTSCAIIAK